MNIINYISVIAVPFVIAYIISYGFAEKIKVFDSFLAGAKDGIKTVIKIFPTLIGLFLAISALRNSGILDLIQKMTSPLLNLLKVPSEILPLMLIRPISGSASTAVALDIMKNFGVDSLIRNNCKCDYGFNRNNSIHYCNLLKYCKSKKTSLRFSMCINCRHSSVC